MELRHLRYFVAVAEELHFGRAAERLFIAQPPLSIQIKQFEAELGFPLFVRTNRTVELTPAGAFFLDEARHVISSLENSVSAARRVARGESGWLGIGFVGSATYALFPKALGQFRAQFPDVELVLRELVSGRQAQALRDGRIHVGLARPPIEEAGTVSEVLVQEPLVAALPASHPLAKKPRIHLSDLAGERFVLFPRHPKPSYADSVIAHCEAAGFTPDVVQETAEMHTAVGLVAAGLGVSLVPESVTAETRPGLVFRSLEPPAPITELAVVYRESETPPVLESFLRILKSTM